LACPLKCYLQSKGEKCAENRFAAWNEAEQESYRLAGVKTLGVGLSSELARDPLDGSQLSNGRWQLALDHTFDVKDLSAKIHGVQRVTRTGKADELIPIRFVHTNKLSPAHRLAAAFDAIVLSMAARKPIGIAKIIHGDAWVHDNVRVAAQGEKLTKLWVEQFASKRSGLGLERCVLFYLSRDWSAYPAAHPAAQHQ
jgi:hypothetical protein